MRSVWILYDDKNSVKQTPEVMRYQFFGPNTRSLECYAKKRDTETTHYIINLTDDKIVTVIVRFIHQKFKKEDTIIFYSLLMVWPLMPSSSSMEDTMILSEARTLTIFLRFQTVMKTNKNIFFRKQLRHLAEIMQRNNLRLKSSLPQLPSS